MDTFMVVANVLMVIGSIAGVIWIALQLHRVGAWQLGRIYRKSARAVTEGNHALRQRLLAFIHDHWDNILREKVSQASEKRELLAYLAQDQVSDNGQLSQLVDTFYGKVEDALERNWTQLCKERFNQWRAEGSGAVKDAVPGDYVKMLRNRTSRIDLDELAGKEDKSVEIERLYVPLKTTGEAEHGDEEDVHQRAQQTRRRVKLIEAVEKHPHLIIEGDPGSGKSTFTKWLVFVLAEIRLGDRDVGELGFGKRLFPLWLKVSELANYMIERRKQGGELPLGPGWLVHFLAHQAEEHGVPLGRASFDDLLTSDEAILVIDSIDEGVRKEYRQEIADILSAAATTERYRRCRIVVTSRPAALDEMKSIKGFPPSVKIADFDAEEDIPQFVHNWCDVRYEEKPAERDAYRDQLLSDINRKPAVLDLAHKPLCLTVLAWLHHYEGKELPEERAVLYQRVVQLLASSRRAPDYALPKLRWLAWYMQTHSSGVQLQLNLRPAAEAIARFSPEDGKEFPADEINPQRIAAEESFLEEATIHTGIVVKRDNVVEFWHQAFREFLAADHVAARPLGQQLILLGGQFPKLMQSDWREVMCLLGGILHSKFGAPGQSNVEEVDKVIRHLLDRCDEQDSLTARCQGAGLVGAMLRDLDPAVEGKYRPGDPACREFMEGHVPEVFLKEPPEKVPIEVAIDAADALGYLGDPRFDEKKRGDHWITIPAGPFIMGAQKDDPALGNYDRSAHDDESPHHSVLLDEYQIARYPVTVAEYQQFLEQDGYSRNEFWQAGGFDEWREPENWKKQLLYPTRPVVYVSWYEAAAYAAFRGCRLPTEAQWERAARGPGGTARKYPWGGDAEPDEKMLNFNSNVGHATPVGVYPLGATPPEAGNADGIEDMAGNVWEWCSDWFANDYYENSPAKDPQGPGTGSSRVLRGGAFSYFAEDVRAALRNHLQPGYRLNHTGFRLART